PELRVGRPSSFTSMPRPLGHALSVLFRTVTVAACCPCMNTRRQSPLAEPDWAVDALPTKFPEMSAFYVPPPLSAPLAKFSAWLLPVPGVVVGMPRIGLAADPLFTNR